MTAAIAQSRPAISIDTKKKELVGECANGGREWAPKGEPVAVNVHDFPDKTLGKAIPYGIYDIGADNGFVNVGITKETAAFAVSSIRSWWQQLGQARYPAARTLQITADCGGSNSSRIRLWKVELQRLANDTGLEISVCHFPPGTSKWNKSAWAAAHQGEMKCCRRSAGRGRRLDSGAQLNPQRVWRRAAGPRIVATSTNPRFGSHQGPSPAGRLSTSSERRQQCSRSHDRVAGLDVHRDSVVACFRQLGPRGGVAREKERFTTTTAGLQVLEAWLAERQAQLVAMEATGVY